MRAPAAARVLAFGILPDDDPVNLLAVPERARDTRQHARRAHVGVLVEALADRQPQAPERNVVGHVGRADRTEENRVESLELLEPSIRDVVTVAQVVIAAPLEMLDVQLEAAVSRGEHLQRLQPGRDHFDADAVTGYGCNPVFTHGRSLTNSVGDGAGC